MGAVSCSSTGSGGYRAPGFLSHSLVWLSTAFHTSLVKACWGAKEGTIRRRRWHAGGDRMHCGAAAVIHLHAVLHDRPPFHGPHALGVDQRLALDQGEIGARAPLSFLPPYPGGPRLQAAEQGQAGEERLRESPLDGLGGVGQGAHGQIPQREGPGARQRLRHPCVPSPLGVWRGGRDRAHLQEVACLLVGVPLEGCREAEPLCRGCHREAAPGLAPGVILVGRPGVEVPGDVLRGPCGGVLWCQVPHDGEHRPRGERPRPRGGVHLDGPLWARPPHAGRSEHPSDHVRCQDQHHSRGFHNDPLCGSAVAAPGVQGHCRLSGVGDAVDGLLDVHAAARGLIQDPALRHPVV